MQKENSQQSPRNKRSENRKVRKLHASRKANARGKARVPSTKRTASICVAHNILEDKLPNHLREAWVVPSELGVSVPGRSRPALPARRQHTKSPGRSTQKERGNKKMNTNKRKKRRPREHSAVAPRVLSPATPVLTRAYAAATAALNARNAAKTATLAPSTRAPLLCCKST